MRDVVFTIKQYKVIKKFDRFTKRYGYIVVNVKSDKFAHTHINDKDTAICIAKNCAYKLTPNTTNLYLLNSHLRLSNDKRYKQYIENIISSISYNVPVRYNYNLYPKYKK